MSNSQNGVRQDAFKERMAAARSEFGRPELAHQSLGRPLANVEDGLATALMELYADGVANPEDLAAKLTERGIVAPRSGAKKWTADTLQDELAALNRDLDQAYLENGFGA